VFTVCIPVSISKKNETVKTDEKIEQKSVVVNNSPEKSNLKSGENLHDETAVQSKPESPDVDYDMPFIPDDRDDISELDNVLLIIEDDPQFAKILLNECHKYNFKGIVSQTAEQGLVLAEKYKPDAITLDLNLPGMNGNKFLKIIKENPSLRHIPVQVLSATDISDLDNEKCIFGILNKPVTNEQLDDVMKNIKGYINKEVKELLIVEDDVNTTKTLEKILKTPDVDISTTTSGNDAYDLILNKNFDCVILDLGINDISGFDLIKKLHKQNLADKKIPPVIVYTGRNLSKEETKELEKYVSTVIIKGEKSDERLLDETALFLHQVVDKMDDEKKKLIKDLHDYDNLFEGKKILLVDDDMRNVFALTHILSEHGFEVVQADNGITALERLEEMNDIDLVLMDVMMPEMDGYTATRKIRESKKHKDLPVIILTAKAMKEDKEKAFESGASDYLTKPVDIDKMLSLIRVWLHK
jgi:CheY-like chemotaxis protein